MEAGEAIFIVIVIAAAFFGMNYLNKFRTTKSEIILTFVAYIFLISMLTYTLVEHFNYTRLIITSVAIIISVFVLYRKYKKYKKETSPNYSSSE